MTERTAVIVFGGGCFWCTEAVFLQLQGVRSVVSGYADGFDRFDTLTAGKRAAGGTAESPTYEAVSSGKTGYAEVIKIEYDPGVIPFRQLLAVFFAAHDPTMPNRQGADVGSQYRSILLYTDESQKREAERYIAELTAARTFAHPIVTEVQPLGAFHPAEEYHRDFYAKHRGAAYSELVITPKVEKIQREYRRLLKDAGSA